MVVHQKLQFDGELDSTDRTYQRLKKKTRKKKDDTRRTVLPKINQIKETSSLKSNKEKIKDIVAMLDFMPQCDKHFYPTIFDKFSRPK